MENHRFVLFSDQVIAENRQVDSKLIAMLEGTDKSVAFISSNPDRERLYFIEKQEYYSLIGIKLAEYFDEEILKSAESRERLISYDAIHLSGGNTFTFRNWVFNLGVGELLINYANSGGVLIGTSAGAILLTPEISTAQLCGDVDLDTESSKNGLGLVDFYIWPHYSRTTNADSEVLSKLDPSMVVYKIPDGSGIVVDNSEIELIGDIHQ